MGAVEVTVTLPGFIAERIATEAQREGRPVDRHILRILFADALRQDAARHRAWAAANPQAWQQEQRDQFLTELDRDVARMVEDGVPADEAEQVAAQALAEFELTFTPGYLDPSNAAIPMTAERHIAILRATMRTQHAQDIADIERRAQGYADAGRDDEARRLRVEADRRRSLHLP